LAVPVAAVRGVEEDAPALVRAVPEQFCGAPSPQRSAATLGPSLYDLIGPQQQRRRDRVAERLGSSFYRAALRLTRPDAAGSILRGRAMRSRSVLRGVHHAVTVVQPPRGRPQDL